MARLEGAAHLVRLIRLEAVGLQPVGGAVDGELQEGRGVEARLATVLYKCIPSGVGARQGWGVCGGGRFSSATCRYGLA